MNIYQPVFGRCHLRLQRLRLKSCVTWSVVLWRVQVLTGISDVWHSRVCWRLQGQHENKLSETPLFFLWFMGQLARFVWYSFPEAGRKRDTSIETCLISHGYISLEIFQSTVKTASYGVGSIWKTKCSARIFPHPTLWIKGLFWPNQSWWLLQQWIF